METSMAPINDRTTCIVQGMELYFRTFALADNMCLHAGDVEWISPRPVSAGPSLVYKVSLDDKTAETRLEKLIPGLKAGVIPSLWVVSPTSTPSNIVDHLLSIGFKGGLDPEHPEPGMALDVDEFSMEPKPGIDIEIRKVQSLNEYALWIDVVNEALHGWKMLSTEHYHAWLRHKPLTFYFGCHHGTPIATLATIQDGNTASVEFVSTLKEYRHHGAATALCIEAIKELQSRGVKTVTLRSSTEAISVYTRIGFKPYYEQLLLSYSPG
jgi:GNAT superfamily N-acetyltransferase